MIGVKLSHFMFKGIVYKKSRVQTRRGVVAPWRQVAFGVELCFGIKMILKQAKFMRGEHFGKVSKTCWLGGPDDLLISSRGPFLPTLSSWSMATESSLRSILYGVLQGVAVLVDSLHACCSCVPSSEILLSSCFSSMGKKCYVFSYKP